MDLFRLIADQAPDAISVHELDGRYRWASPMFGHLLGMEPQELVGLDAYDFFHPQDILPIRASHTELLEGGDVTTVQYRIRRSDETYRWVETTSRVVPEEQVVISVTRPIDLRHSAMTALGAERALTARVKQVDEQHRQFMTAIAHRARHPITIVRGMAELLKHRAEKMTDEQRTMAVDRIFSNAKALQQLIEDVTQAESLARRAAGIRIRPLPLHALIREIIAEVATDEAPITVTVPPEAVLVGDDRLVRVALRLLLDNALAHTPLGTPIWIRKERKHDGSCLIVEDAGPGIPASQREFIFEPFQRVEAEAPDPGLGLGLHTVAEIAAQHGGRVWVEERPGGGASFHLLLPSSVADDRMARASASTAKAVTDDVRVLVVDDDPNITAMLAMAIGEEGYDVAVAMTGEAALDHALGEPPDLFVLDAALPGIDGRELTRRIRAHPSLGSVPVVMFSALADPLEEQQALEAGVDVFVAKTVGVDKLLRELQRLLAFRRAAGLAHLPTDTDAVG